ncbi:bacterial extracellular solute-binding family protein, partial [Vibrio parahaemolyticus 12310]
TGNATRSVNQLDF